VRLFFSSLVAAIVAMPAFADDVPRFQVDAAWPKPLPNDWIMGQAAGVAVDAQDHIWVIQRPRTLTDDEKALTLNPPPSKCCRPAPAVMEFDGEGNLVQAWGGPGEGYDWPQNEHGISIDAAGFVWIGGNGDNDGQYLKFTRAGKFVLQIGKSGAQTNSNDVTRLGRPADAEVDPETNEVYIADGYFNQRVIVFDANTGAYKRHWGAYGKKPTDEKLPYSPAAAPSPQFGNPVHCVKIAKDGLVYICDRANDRIQVFRKDGTFVRSSSSKRIRCAPDRFGISIFGSIPSRHICSTPTAATTRYAPYGAKPERSSVRSAATAATRGSFTGCTIWRSIQRATFSLPRWTPVSGRRNSVTWGRLYGKGGELG